MTSTSPAGAPRPINPDRLRRELGASTTASGVLRHPQVRLIRPRDGRVIVLAATTASALPSRWRELNALMAQWCQDPSHRAVQVHRPVPGHPRALEPDERLGLKSRLLLRGLEAASGPVEQAASAGGANAPMRTSLLLPEAAVVVDATLSERLAEPAARLGWTQVLALTVAGAAGAAASPAALEQAADPVGTARARSEKVRGAHRRAADPTLPGVERGGATQELVRDHQRSAGPASNAAVAALAAAEHRHVLVLRPHEQLPTVLARLVREGFVATSLEQRPGMAVR